MKHTAHGWWLEEAGGAEPQPPLSGTETADVVVVGGGYTGMWTAWHVLEREPNARVAIVEADVCGHGPSGRNGGFCESLWVALPSLRKTVGDQAALALARASSESVEGIGRWCEEHEVDAWYRRAPYLSVSTTAVHDRAVDTTLEAAAELGVTEEIRPLTSAEVRTHCDSPVFRQGLRIDDCATVQPARLALGLRRKLLERGVRIFERTHMRRVALDGPGAVRVETDGGSLSARAAVLAVGSAVRTLPALRSRLTVTSSHIVLTEPVPDLIEEIGWTGGESITDGRTLVHYFRTTRDGRIAFGWGGGRLAFGARAGRVELDGSLPPVIRDDLLRIFPGLRGRELTHAWGGPIDVSPSHVPQLGTLAGGSVHYAFGYTGNGVGPSHLAARVLASRSLDRRDDDSRLPFPEGAGAYVPPEPLAWLGGSAVRAAWVRRERLEIEGKPVDALTKAATVAPALMGVHLAR